MKIRKNGDLRDLPSVRVIGSTGEMLGVMATSDALRLAEREGLDLVEVNPKAQPPACKLLDSSRYRYEEAKKVAVARRAASVVVVLVRSKLALQGRPGKFLVGDIVTGEGVRTGMLVCIAAPDGRTFEIPILAVEFMDHRTDGASELALHVVGRTPEQEEALEGFNGPELLDVVDRPS